MVEMLTLKTLKEVIIPLTIIILQVVSFTF